MDEKNKEKFNKPKIIYLNFLLQFNFHLIKFIIKIINRYYINYSFNWIYIEFTRM